MSTIFDNERTFLYKWAVKNKVPSNLVLIRYVDDNEVGSDNEVSGAAGDTFNDYIYESIRHLIQKTSLGQSKLRNVVDTLNELSVAPINVDDIIFLWYEKVKSGNPSNILREINQTEEKYTDIADLETYYEDWKRNLKKIAKEDVEKVNKITQSQEELLTVQPVSRSSVILDMVKYNIHPVYRDGEAISPDDSLDIFNEAIVSLSVPFIAYKSGNQFYSKVSSEWSHRVANILISSTAMNLDNSIYINIYTGSHDEISSDAVGTGGAVGGVPGSGGGVAAVAGGVSLVIYHLETNTLTFKTDPDDLANYLDILHAALPSIEIEVSAKDDSEVEAHGEIYVGDPLVLSVFADAILREELFNVFTYVDEFSKPQGFKKRMRIFYKEFKELTFGEDKIKRKYITNINFQQIYVDFGTEKLLHDDQKITLEPGSAYLKSKFQSTSRKHIKEFVTVITYIVGYYQERIREDLEATYRELYPLIFDVSALEKETGQTASRGRTTAEMPGKSNLKLILEKAPDVAVSGYGTSCQAGHQPLVIDEEDVEKWTSETFQFGNQVYNRQVLPFPAHDPKYYFGCDNPMYPFVGIKKNVKMSNKEEYPYIPCCYGSDQMNSENIRSIYNKYYGDQTIDLVMPNKLPPIHSRPEVLHPYHAGKIHKDISELIRRYSDMSGDIVRIGMVESPNSLLHCVCEAASDVDYLNTSIGDRENFVDNLRSGISKGPLESAKQQMYDSTLDQIREQIEDFDTFLDPLLYYRLVEEYFNVNIYIFSMDSSGLNGKMEFPRFKNCHLKIMREDRPVVLILRHWGAKKANLKYPQCELLVDVRENGDIVKLFGLDLNIILYNAMMSIGKTLTVTHVGEEVKVYQNLYAKASLDQLYASATKSFVDNYGKMRGVVFQHNGIEIAAIGSLQEPLDVPITRTLPKPPVDIVIEVFGKPNKLCYDSSNRVSGLWYSYMNGAQQLLVPIEPLTGGEATQSFGGSVERGPRNPLEVIPGRSLDHIRTVKKDAILMSSLLEYLFDMYRKDIANTPGADLENVNDFNDYFVVLAAGPDTVRYDFSQVPKKLQESRNTTEALEYLSEVAPSIFSREGIKCSEVLKVKFGNYIKSYFNKTRGLSMTPKTTLSIYLDESDFIQNPETYLFMSEKTLRTWARSVTVSENHMTVFSKLNYDRSADTDPYFYHRPNGQYYLIQNVNGGALGRATQVAVYWNKQKKNIGYNPENAEIEAVRVVYGISPNRDIVVLSNETDGQSEYIELLFYGSVEDFHRGLSKYAAMLPLLV